MLEIRRAKPDEYRSVRYFYHQMIDDMENMTYKPGWQKEVYPSDDMLKEALARGELYIGELLKGNVPAECLYPSAGFTCLHTLPMFYEDTGWTDFLLYEKILK